MILYELRILCDAKTKREIEAEIGISIRDFKSNWYKQYGDENVMLKDVERNLRIVKDKFNILDTDMTLWLFYSYKNECNLEFDKKILHSIGNFGISFCISCWQE